MNALPSAEPLNPGPVATGRGTGCWVPAILVGCFFAIYSFWAIGAPSRHAEALRAHVHPGMSVLEVRPLLTDRHVFTCSGQWDGEWKVLTWGNCAKVIQAPEQERPQGIELRVTFLGLAGNKTSITIKADGAGRIITMGPARNWD